MCNGRASNNMVMYHHIECPRVVSGSTERLSRAVQ